MFHFFPRYAKDVTDTPYAAELRRLGVPHRFFADRVNLRYRTALGLLLKAYPRLFWFALRSAVVSLLLSSPKPTAVIVASDVEALVFGGLRRILRRSTVVVFETVILSHLENPLHRRYYGLVLSLTDLGICHSRAEVARYTAAFPDVRCRFVFIPYGTNITRREALMEVTEDQHAAIVTAGRSGRDYPVLAEAIAGLPCTLHIICDTAAPLADLVPSGQIVLLRACFNQAYLEALAAALFVVIPLAVDDVSAGQMVLLQACGLGKAIIITRTATISDYVTGGEDALLVTMGDVAEMRAAVQRLLSDVPLRRRLAAGAARRFERDHSTEVYVRRLVTAVKGVKTELKNPLPDATSNPTHPKS